MGTDRSSPHPVSHADLPRLDEGPGIEEILGEARLDALRRQSREEERRRNESRRWLASGIDLQRRLEDTMSRLEQERASRRVLERRLEEALSRLADLWAPSFPAVELPRLPRDQNGGSSAELADVRFQLDYMEGSRSWRYTRPCRDLYRRLRRLLILVRGETPADRPARREPEKLPSTGPDSEDHVPSRR